MAKRKTGNDQGGPQGAEPQVETEGATEPMVADEQPGAEVIDLAEARSHLPEAGDEQAGGEDEGSAAGGEEQVAVASEDAETEPMSVSADAAQAEGEETTGPVPFEQLEPLIESLLFASDRPLSVSDLKRLTGERDSRLINEALEALMARRAESGVQVIAVGGGYCFRTNPAFGDWVSKLLAGKPVRLSRAMLETLAIVAYRQPITRPEMDEIRGVDCGPVLKSLLDRGLIRIIGKKEEVGRPMLYGTTPEFLRIFSLKDLTELPTLRQFHELSAEHQAKVAAKHGQDTPAETPNAADMAASLLGAAGELAPATITAAVVSPDPDEDDGLLDELEQASELASRAAGPLTQSKEAEETPPSGE